VKHAPKVRINKLIITSHTLTQCVSESAQTPYLQGRTSCGWRFAIHLVAQAAGEVHMRMRTGVFVWILLAASVFSLRGFCVLADGALNKLLSAEHVLTQYVTG